ncbi:MAG: carboxylesterase family protein, partial [Deltaproteobacteria bacterium]|nr:carboxylesterase family protein [Deltaproteobacteria bacterium]
MEPLSPRRVLAPLAAVAVLAGCSPPTPPTAGTADPQTARSLPQGQVVGFAGEFGAHNWRGIPFAEPPVGPLRWRAPRPAPAWEGVREALVFGSACPQIANAAGGWDGAERGAPTGREDCLTLNVFAPPWAPERVPSGQERKPVMVWIHGGGNSVGDALPYDAGNLAASHDLLVVTVQYRLGPLGWFRHASLRGEGTSAEDRSGNFGTLDLIQALDWVRENIAAFGGDPRRVTIFGESAGGRNVYTLLLSPLARGLFHRAVVQSGGLRSHSPAEAENFADDPEPGHAASSNEILLKHLALSVSGAGEEEPRSAARMKLDAFSPDQVEQYLRAIPPGELLRLYDVYGGTGMLGQPQVFRDGFVLPEDPLRNALAEGRYNQVPVIVGTNRDESKLFMSFNPEYVRTVMRVPLWRRDAVAYERDARYGSNTWKALGVDGPAESMRRVQGPSVFAYRFDWDELASPLWLDLPTLLGAAHAIEIPFVFGRFELGRVGSRIFDETSEPDRTQLAQAMMSYWAQLAHNGDPGHGRDWKLPRWQAWGTGDNTFLVLDSQAGGGIRMSDERVTVQGLVDAVLQDADFPDDATRCVT